MLLHRLLVFGVLLVAGPAWPQQPAPSPAERAERRFPQPVRVGDLIRRQLLRPVVQQTVLGRVAGVARRPDGAVLLVVDVGGLLGFGTRPVAVPVEVVALLGEHVALMDLTPEQLEMLPTFKGGAMLVASDERIRVGLVRPFH